MLVFGLGRKADGGRRQLAVEFAEVVLAGMHHATGLPIVASVNAAADVASKQSIPRRTESVIT
jgi:hypothetical protein